MRKIIAFVSVGVLALAGAPLLAEEVPLFDANWIFTTYSPNNFDLRFVFDETEITLTCYEGDTATLTAPAAEGGSVIVDNFMTVNGVNVCDLGTAGPGIESPAGNFNCFQSGSSAVTGVPIETRFTGIGDIPLSVGAGGIIPLGKSAVSFELWDWGSVAGNTSLDLQTTCNLPCTTDLIADGGSDETAIVVGDVTVVDNGDGTWNVTYQTTGGWEMIEIHLDVACGDGAPPYDFPMTRKGNPKVGQFCFQDYPDPPTQSYTVEAISPDACHDSGACSCAVFAAHAVVLDASSCDDAIVYGTMRGDGTFGHGGDIYAIDLVSKTATWLFGTGLTPGDQNQPNGNAYDAPNHRLYYSADGVEGGTPSSLYFYDFAGTQTWAGQLTGFVVGAAFYNGRYYYIPNGTDDLWAVSFLADGTMASNDLVLADFTGTKVYRFGDIAISTGGILYASTNGTSGSTAELFQIDLGTVTYTRICGTETAGCAHSLQLAFGSDGTLYAHSAGTGEFFTVAANGVGTSIGSTTGSDTNQYTDLASGQLCFPRVETAWGDGIEFPGSNWATYFQCGDCP